MLTCDSLTPARSQLLDRLISFLLGIENTHPLRVGIDGITASGKSTLARELAERLRQSGRPVILTTLDGFHYPRSRRYERGRDSPDGYYFDSYNYPAVLDLLLRPLGPGGSRIYCLTSFDLSADQPIEIKTSQAAENAILVVDGSFAMRDELRDHWDASVYVDVDFNIAEERAAERDAEAFGSADLARHTTRVRYHGAHRIHQARVEPALRANFVVNNNDPDSPVVTKG